MTIEHPLSNEMALILAIQPDSSQASALRHALRAIGGAAVVVVESAEAALAAIDRQRPDLVLLHAFMTLADEMRITVIDGHGGKAWTSPIWLDDVATA